ncbi:hypothetical protein VHEMI04859 [[Torrubiella] hemipterigena]|uniref:Uncharacterized protein n=1 Tax=[Torrubiella] hemipterigena TaxID=1531966 RepID=A0A0A1SWE4_9HYPO|nr:hypothetical protein VHEMI04859 [[Torrubiella] hemipterigena]
MNALPFLLRHRGILRLLTFGSFIPALPLGLAHGILSDDAFPAVGLIPMLISAVSGIFLHRHEKQKQKALQDAEAAGQDPEEASRGYIAEGVHEIDTLRGKLTHPFTVFVFDTLMSATIMAILVYTWRAGSRSVIFSMLAAYATIPLMVAFISHATLAFSELYHGFAVHGFAKWVASKAVDSHCPKCSHPIQPEMPEVPWFKLFKGWGKRPGSGVTAPLLTDGASDASEISKIFFTSNDAIDVRSKKLAFSLKRNTNSI